MGASIRQLSVVWRFSLLLMLFVAVAAVPGFAYALGVTPAYTDAGNIACIVAGFMFGNLGRALAIVGIASFGIGAMLGRVSWSQAIIVIAGVGTIFGCYLIAQWAISVTGQATWFCYP